MALREFLCKFMNEYATELTVAKTEKDYKRPFGDLVRKDIVGCILSHVNEEQYKVKGSVGAGRWTDVPWIAVFDKRITSSAQRGVYIVYLLNKDSKELYLTLNQGATNIAQGDSSDIDVKLAFTGIATANSGKTVNNLKDKALSIRQKLGNDIDLDYGEIDTGSKAYDAGCIYYKRYEINSIPDDEVLYSDLSKFLEAYQAYYKVCVCNSNIDACEWWPSLEEYSPAISVEDWVNLIGDQNVFKPKYLAIMKRMKDVGGAASCAQLAEKYGEDKNFYNVGSSTLAEYVAKRTGCRTDWTDKVNAHWWPVIYQGRKAREDEPGGYVYRLRDELSDALDKVDLSDIPLYVSKDEGLVMTDKQILDNIKTYIAGRGFSYNDGLIENFYLSLKSKPFVILAGTSGTGKTRLVKLFAEAIGAVFKLVSVRPDWSDGSDLFGHTDLNGNFIPGPVCSAFDTAINEPTRPVLLCLDEMNLARVEYYLSDYLSVIESREKVDDHIVTEGIAQYENGIPDNLYIVGTVNMDETTFPFSKKVLDRANTIEFSYVDLIPSPCNGAVETPLQLTNSFLCTEYLVLANDCVDDKDFVEKVCTDLQSLNEKLVNANAHVGYRVRDEIVFYMLNNKNAGDLLTYDQAFDNEIMQKILPRIQGSSSAIKTLLIDMFKYCLGSGYGLDPDSGNVGEQMRQAAASAQYPESAKKIGYMMTRFEDDGFTSYWL